MAVELRKGGPPDLLHHGLVAAVLGYPLAIALSLMMERLLRACGAGATVNQLTMWIVYPLWLAVICAALLMQIVDILAKQRPSFALLFCQCLPFT